MRTNKKKGEKNVENADMTIETMDNNSENSGIESDSSDEGRENKGGNRIDI